MEGAPPVIFISYRRNDAAGHSGRLFDALGRELGEGEVFRDVQSIAAGEDFMESIGSAISKAEGVIVLVGPDWLAAGADGAPRIQAANDIVRAEVRLALELKKRVVPVLVGGARMPGQAQLPEDIRAFARCNAVELSEARWDYDAGRLLKALGHEARALGKAGLPWLAMAGAGLAAATLALDAGSDYGLRQGARMTLGAAAAALSLADLKTRKTRALRWPGLAWLGVVLGGLLLLVSLARSTV